MPALPLRPCGCAQAGVMTRRADEQADCSAQSAPRPPLLPNADCTSRTYSNARGRPTSLLCAAATPPHRLRKPSQKRTARPYGPAGGAEAHTHSHASTNVYEVEYGRPRGPHSVPVHACEQAARRTGAETFAQRVHAPLRSLTWPQSAPECMVLVLADASSPACAKVATATISGSAPWSTALLAPVRGSSQK